MAVKHLRYARRRPTITCRQGCRSARCSHDRADEIVGTSGMADSVRMNGCGAPRDGALGVVTFMLTAEASRGGQCGISTRKRRRRPGDRSRAPPIGGIITRGATPVSTQCEPELVGQTVVVIGGSAGIGLETARRARAEGAGVILPGRNPERLRQAALGVGAQRTAAFDAGDTAAFDARRTAAFDANDSVSLR